MASGKDSRSGASKKNSSGKKKADRNNLSALNSHKKQNKQIKNSYEKKGGSKQRPSKQQIHKIGKQNIQSRGEAAQKRQRPVAQERLQRDNEYNYPQNYSQNYSYNGGYRVNNGGRGSNVNRNYNVYSVNMNNGAYSGYNGYSRSQRADHNGYSLDYDYNYVPQSSYYAGRGQMSYEDFVRNRELFGGEEKTELHRSRRTGGTVKRTPEQGRNKKNGSNTKSVEPNNQALKLDENRKNIKHGEKASELNKKKRSRSRAQMDERARRKKIKRHAGRASKTMTPRKRKIKRFLTGFSIFMVIAVISVLLSLTVFFKMEKIIVTGETRYSYDDIISLSQIETGENIFLCDKAGASQRIVDALPYVAEAKVGFVIPNAITIEIVEEVPSYAMGYSDGYYIVGENGRILEKTAENYYHLPVVQGAEITTNQVGDYANFSDKNITSILAELVRVLEAYDFDQVTVIDVSDTANIRFVFDDRITVVLGIPEDVAYKVKTAQTIINDKLDPNGTGLIKGRLDVSMCNETKKSYFNENEVYQPIQNQTNTTEPTGAETQETADTTEQQGETEETAEGSEEIQETEQPAESSGTEAAEPSSEETTAEGQADEQEFTAAEEDTEGENHAENADSQAA